MKYIFANLKENLSYAEAKNLVLGLCKSLKPGSLKDRTVVILPPVVYLIPLSRVLAGSKIQLGAQDVSRFPGGAYTGEIAAKMVKPYGEFCLIGHSERRANFGETTETVNQKLSVCLEEGLIPIICVSSQEQLEDLVIPRADADIFVVYEPTEFIGGEETQTINEIYRFAQVVRRKIKAKFIYGGSVNEKNAQELLRQDWLDGLLIGHTSLEPKKFGSIISNQF